MADARVIEETVSKRFAKPNTLVQPMPAQQRSSFPGQSLGRLRPFEQLRYRRVIGTSGIWRTRLGLGPRPPISRAPRAGTGPREPTSTVCPRNFRAMAWHAGWPRLHE